VAMLKPRSRASGSEGAKLSRGPRLATSNSGHGQRRAVRLGSGEKRSAAYVAKVARRAAVVALCVPHGTWQWHPPLLKELQIFL